MKARDDSNKRCFICGKPMVELPPWHSFAHILPKGTYPDYKFDANNVKMVCSIDCHEDLDVLTAGKRKPIARQIDLGKNLSLDDIKLL